VLEPAPRRDIEGAARAVGLSVAWYPDGSWFVPCDGGWQAAAFLKELAERDAKRPDVIAFARDVLARCGGDPKLFVEVCQALTKSFGFAPEEGEIFQGPQYTAEHGGDCDDHARFVYAMGKAAGVPVDLAFLHEPGGDPDHVLARAKVHGKREWVETTLDAGYGEHPVTAAKRLGVLRADMSAPEVSVMADTLQVLPNHGYRMRLEVQGGSTDDVDVVRTALEDLGFVSVLCKVSEAGEGEIESGDRHWVCFAHAVWSFPPANIPLDLGAIQITDSAEDDEAAAPSAGGSGGGSAATMGALGAVTLSRDLSDGFFTKSHAIAERQNLAWLPWLAVMFNESGLHASAHNPAGAFGISQLMSFVLPNAGWHDGGDAFIALSAEEQLPYVENYYRGHAHDRLDSLERIYQANFLPATLGGGSDPGRVLLRKGGAGFGGQEDLFYRSNPVFDHDHKGFITVRDLGEAVHRSIDSSPRWREIEARALGFFPDEPPVTGGGGRIAPAGIASVSSGGGAASALKAGALGLLVGGAVVTGAAYAMGIGPRDLARGVRAFARRLPVPF
jgi:hypothetical protein